MDFAKLREDIRNLDRNWVVGIDADDVKELIAVVDAARAAVNEAFRTSGRLEAETAGALAKALHKLGA